jgi:type I restriction enzyme M protein
MTDRGKTQLGKTLWGIADDLRGAMNADDFRDYMLSFLFLRYLSDNYEAAAQKELGRDYPKVEGEDRRVPLTIWYANNPDDLADFEKQMRRKVHYVIGPHFSSASLRGRRCASSCSRLSTSRRCGAAHRSHAASIDRLMASLRFAVR